MRHCRGRDESDNFKSFDYQLFVDLSKLNTLIMSVFHGVPGVPCAKMERLQPSPDRMLLIQNRTPQCPLPLQRKYFTLCNFLSIN